MAEIIGALAKALGKGQKKVFAGAVNVADGDTVNTGLKSIDVAVLTSTAATHIASVGGISGGVITVKLTDVDPALTEAAAVTTAETVYVLAIGDPR